MASVAEGEKPKMARGKEAEDDSPGRHRDKMTSPASVVQPCCRLPRETIVDLASTKNPSKVVSAVSTPTSDEYSSKKASLMGGKVVAEESEKCPKKIMEKSDEAGSSIEVDETEIISMVKTPPVSTSAFKGIRVEKSTANASNPSNVAVPRVGSARRSPPNLDESPLILATHLVPSLPIALFEVLAEVIEAATGKAVNLLYESRVDRPVAKDIVDIAILPASGDWTDGSLLPVSFVFEHRLNREKKPGVYVDIVVAPDCMRNVKEVVDLRGYRCALPDRRKTLGAAGLLFSHLRSKGENPSFFGNTLDSGSQVATLQMVAGKQAVVGVLEAPVINYHRNTLPGVEMLYILASLGPLPPYKIMLNKNLEATIREKIKNGLLTIEKEDEWMERLRPFGVIAFAEYSEDRYDTENVKSVVTSVPYY